MRFKDALHYIYEAALSIKFVEGLLQVFGAIFLYFSTPGMLNDLAHWILRSELLEDPQDFAANTLLSAFNSMTLAELRFAALYILVSGSIKIFLVLSLWLKRAWAYPAAAIMMVLFVLYQTYLLLSFFTIIRLSLILIDIIILSLLHMEYLKRKKTRGS